MHLGLRLFLPFAAGYFLSYLLRNVNAVIAPELTRELGVSAADLGLLTSAYLLTFGAFQLPLGILLDRYGPRRVEAALLLIAAAGSAWFAVGTSLGELAAARALIGLGVCACLMAAFKAFAVWFPAERLPSLNSAVMVAGGLGALTATTPLAWAAPILGTPGPVLRARGAGRAGRARHLLDAGQAGVGRRRHARSAVARAGRGAVQPGVLALRADDGHRPRRLRRAAGVVGRPVADGGQRADARGGRLPHAADHARDGRWLPRHGGGHRPAAPARAAAGPRDGGRQRDSACSRCSRCGGAWAARHALWFVLGVVFAVGNLAYAELTSRFEPTLAGRVNAALNLATFVGAFSIQWGYGVLLDGLRAAGWIAVEQPPGDLRHAAGAAGRRLRLVSLEPALARTARRGSLTGKRGAPDASAARYAAAPSSVWKISPACSRILWNSMPGKRSCVTDNSPGYSQTKVGASTAS